MSPGRRRARWAYLLALCSCLGCRVRDTGSQDAGSPGEIDAGAAASEGYAAVQTRACGKCHQSSLPGDGVLSGQDVPVPGTHAYGSNLTPDPDTGMDVLDAGIIATSVLAAMGPDGGALCPAMPAYADAGMDASEATAIALYLKTLTPVWHPVPVSSCAAR